MSDEVKLAKAVDRASRAERLLGDDLLKEAFETLEKSYIDAWRATTIHATADREKLFVAINVVGKVRDHLNSVVQNGKLAKAELATLSEPKKRFGIV
ncbi:hypothetical protein [Bradyrhizobium sp. LVM 105]|uniref:hypothetical protein n=1 Tax=Bradyrhizobium sp. LVM 105 TaxID=2341115 RepID=UPI000F7FBC2E|nr:hypothetical protein [Bradyrhizobium sp. LVM 105]RTE91901.1 hypothetical protein D6B98_15920 [Bradyrhizobium sp. LVM 105]